MDSNTLENQLDAAKLMHHSQEMRLGAYAAYREILNQPTSDIELEMAAKAMHHSKTRQSEIYGQISQKPFE